jgi:hypothetical protein
MVDNSMNDDDWSGIKTRITGWFDSHSDWEGEYIALLAVPQLVAAGDVKTDARKSLYAAIRTCFGDIPDKPFRAGRGSTMPDAVIAARDGVLALYHSAKAAMFEDSEAVQALDMLHGKSGGGNYESASDFADADTKSRRLLLNAAYNAHIKNNDDAPYTWNGESPVVLVCQIEPPQEEDVVEVTDED